MLEHRMLEGRHVLTITDSKHAMSRHVCHASHAPVLRLGVTGSGSMEVPPWMRQVPSVTTTACSLAPPAPWAATMC